MILESVKLKNIRSYTNETIEFPDGSVLLSGDIGSGKSTILMAIEFALFGVSKGQVSGESLLRKGTTEGTVELAFSIKETKYVVKRFLKIQRDKVVQPAGYILENDVRKDMMPTEMKAFITKTLGYPEESTSKKSYIFRYTLYTPQEDMKRILVEEKSERIDTLRMIFGIDKYKQIRENSLVFVRSLREQQRQEQGRVEDLPQKEEEKLELSKQYGSINLKISEINEDIEDILTEVTKKKELTQRIEKDIVAYEELKRELSINERLLEDKVNKRMQNKKDIEEMQISVENIREKVSKFKEIEIKTDELEVEREILILEKDLREKTEQNAMLKEKLKSINSRIEEMTLEKDESHSLDELKYEQETLNQKLLKKEEIQEEQNNMTLEINKILIELSEAQINKKNAEELKLRIADIDDCPTCLQPVEEEHKHSIISREDSNIKNYLLNLEKAKKLKEEKESLLLLHQEKLDQLQKDAIELEKIKAQIKIAEKLKGKDKILEELENDKKEIKIFDDEEILEYEEIILNKRKQVKDILEKKQMLIDKEHYERNLQDKIMMQTKLVKQQEELKLEIGSINRNKMELKEKMEAFGQIEILFRTRKGELEEVKEKENKKKVEQATLVNERKNIEYNIERVKKEIIIRQKSKAKLIENKRLQLWIEDYFMELMQTIEKHVMVKIHQEFNSLIQQWFNVLIEDENLNIKLNDDFSPIIEQNGYETEVMNLSGGEKTSAALAYRLALNKVINEMIGTIQTKDMIILDEPTDGFSTEQLDKLRDVLDELKCKQTIIVSHESKIESMVENVIKIVKDEHCSRVIS